MGLREAVEAVIKDMDDHASKDTNGIGERWLARTWAAQLRGACMAAGGSSLDSLQPDELTPEQQHAAEIAKARAAIRRQRAQKALEDLERERARLGEEQEVEKIQTGGELVNMECIGGPLHGEIHAVPYGLADEARVGIVDGHVYIYRNGGLHYE